MGADDGGFDAADLDRDLIAERLQKDVVRSPCSPCAFALSDRYTRYSLSTLVNCISMSPTQ